MKVRTGIRSAAGVALGLGIAAATVLPASAAQAGYFGQTWGSGNYHASYDFTPYASSVAAGGKACSGGAARKFYVSLVRTRDSARIKSSASWAADGSWKGAMTAGVSSGTSYYLRWYGQNSNENNGYSAPCAGADAAW